MGHAIKCQPLMQELQQNPMMNRIKNFLRIASENLPTSCNAILVIIVTAISFVSCSNKIHVSEYNIYNKVDNNYYQTFGNDSLQFSVDFYGRNTFQPLDNERKYPIPKHVESILKSLGIRKHAKVLFYLKPGIQKYGQASYGFIVDKSKLTVDTSFFSYQPTKAGDRYFIAKDWYKNRNTTNAVGGVEVGNNYFVLIESQTLLASAEWDSTLQLKNTQQQLSTLLKGEKQIAFLNRRKSIIHRLDSNIYSHNYLLPIAGLQSNFNRYH